MSARSAGELDSLLMDGLSLLELAAEPEQRRSCLQFVSLLQQWNKAYNLTATSDPSEILTRHVLDSLSIARHLQGSRILDVGTGAGFPGIPLAMWFPTREFHLLDSNGKKIRFLFQVRKSLGLDNVTLHQQRVESLRDEAGFDCIVSRAFASLGEFVDSSRHLCRRDGCFLAMKAELREGEAMSVAAPYTVDATYRLLVPGSSATRQLIRVSRNDNT